MNFKSKRLILILLPVLFTAQACNFLFGDLTGESGSGVQGVFRSADSGSTWGAVNTVIQNKSLGKAQVSQLFIEKNDPANLLVATLNQGLYGTDSNGDTWIPLLQDVAVYDAFISSTNSKVIFAAGNQNRVAIILKSSDRGKTWVPVYSESGTPTAVTVVRSPGDAGQIIYAGLASGIVLRSDDEGATWDTLANFDDRVVDLRVPAQNGETIYVLTRVQGLYVSADGGKTWTLSDIDKKVEAYFAAAVDPKNARVVYGATDRGLYRSDNGGETWTTLLLPSKPNEQINVKAVSVNPQDSREIFAAIRWTVYRSADAGDTWKTVALPTRRNIVDIEINPAEPNKVYAGTK